MVIKKKQKQEEKQEGEAEKETKGKKKEEKKVKTVETESKIAPWLKLSQEEIENLVLKLYKEGVRMEKIGLILRDSYGIPKVKEICGKKIKKIIEKHEQVMPPEIVALNKKIKRIKRHLESNKKDMVAKRSLQIKEARLLKIKKYYKVND